MDNLARYLVMGALTGALLGACESAESSKQQQQQLPPRPGREVATGGARVRGGGVTMDVQLGRGLTTGPGSSGSVGVTPHSVVTP